MFRSPVFPRATAAASCTAASLEATSAMCLAISAEGVGAAPGAAAGIPSPDNSASATRTDFDKCLCLLLVGALMIDPVAALVRARVLAPRLWLDQTLRPVHDLELAVLQDLADQHRLVRVLVVLVHLDLAAGREELLPVHRLPHRVDLERLRLLDRLLPDVDAEVRRLHRIVGHALVAPGQVVLLGEGLERRDELLVLRRVHGLV